MATPADLENLRNQISNTPALKKRLANCANGDAAVAEILRIAGELGLSTTDAEIRTALRRASGAKGELTEAELASVAGGIGVYYGPVE